MESNPLEKKPTVDKPLDEEFSKEVSPTCLALYKATMENPEFRSEEVSGLQVGRTLQIFAKKSRNVLEIGTLTGLGTLFIAEALPDGGRVTTIDLEDGPAQELARKYWNMAGVMEKITARTGDALVIIPEFDNDAFDLVFIDGQNVQYQNYLDAVLSRVQVGGSIIIDDTLDGDLKDPTSERDKRTIQFNKRLRDDNRFTSVVALNVGEGITIAVKK